MDDEDRFGVLRRLLHDDDLELSDRVAGCLVLLYGQQVSRIVRLTRDQVSERDGILRLHLGPTHIEVPEPLATLLRRLPGARRPKNGVVLVDSPWLFPGVNPGQPLNASHLGQRLRRLDIPTMPGRRRAMAHLAARLPAAVLADLVGHRSHYCRALGPGRRRGLGNLRRPASQKRRSRTLTNTSSAPTQRWLFDTFRIPPVTSFAGERQ